MTFFTFPDVWVFLFFFCIGMSNFPELKLAASKCYVSLPPSSKNDSINVQLGQNCSVIFFKTDHFLSCRKAMHIFEPTFMEKSLSRS